MTLQSHQGPSDDSTENAPGENCHESEDARQSGRNGRFDRFEYVGHAHHGSGGYARVPRPTVPRVASSIRWDGRSVRLEQ